MKSKITVVCFVLLAVFALMIEIMYFQDKNDHKSQERELNASIEELTAEGEDKDARIAELTAAGEGKDAQIAELTAAGEGKDAQIAELTAAGQEKDARITELTAAASQGTSAEDLSGISDGEYRQTKRFIREVINAGFVYSSGKGNGTPADDKVTLKFTNESYSGVTFKYTANVYFRSKEDRLEIKAWDVIEFNPSDKNAVISVCNDLNNTWLFVRFYVESDDSVTAAFDMPLLDIPDSGKNSWEAYELFDAVLSAAYDDLLPYKK